MDSVYHKYLKYKNKYIKLKNLLGGSEWILNRNNKMEKYKEFDMSTLKKYENDSNILGKGGQSIVYKLDEFDKDLCLRVFKNPDDSHNIIKARQDLREEDKKIILNDSSYNNSEIYYSKLISNIISKNINPHFVMSINFLKDGDKIYQLFEKFDGDITQLKERTDSMKIFEQLLFSLLTLQNNNIIITDVKEDNIFYKKLDKPINIHYKIVDQDYYIYTDYLFVIADYGMAQPVYEKNERNFITLQQIIQLFSEDKKIEKLLTNLEVPPICGKDQLTRFEQLFSRNNSLIDCIKNIINKYKEKKQTILKDPVKDIHVYGPFNVLEKIEN